MCTFWTACKQNTSYIKVYDSPVIAEVGNKKLYQQQLDESGMYDRAMSISDSNQVKTSYIQQWIRSQIMVNEAENTLADDIDIDMLVNDYRESLLLYNYENHLIANQLDTTITLDQISRYYQQNVSNFKLSEPILRCRYARISGDRSGLENFYNNWKRDKTENVNEYLSSDVELVLMNDSTWYTAPEILSYLPTKISTRSLSTKKNIQTAEDGSEYFVKILQYIDKSEDPPLSYIMGNIKKIILHNRKEKLLAKLKEDLYQREINNSNVKIY